MSANKSKAIVYEMRITVYFVRYVKLLSVLLQQIDLII